MESLHEYALLVPMVLPAAIVVAMNVLLSLSGERGTLLLPQVSPL